MGVFNICHPIAKGFVDGVLEGAGPSLYRNHRCAKKLHASDVEGLTFGINLTHVDDTLEPKKCGSGCARYSVLPSACFGDYACLSHALSQKRLTQNVVDFVRARVIEVFPLQEHADVTSVRGESFRFGNDAWSTGVSFVEFCQFEDEVGVCLSCLISTFELVEGSDQRLGHEAAAKLAKVRPYLFAQLSHRFNPKSVMSSKIHRDAKLGRRLPTPRRSRRRLRRPVGRQQHPRPREQRFQLL